MQCRSLTRGRQRSPGVWKLTALLSVCPGPALGYWGIQEQLSGLFNSKDKSFPTLGLCLLPCSRSISYPLLPVPRELLVQYHVKRDVQRVLTRGGLGLTVPFWCFVLQQWALGRQCSKASSGGELSNVGVWVWILLLRQGKEDVAWGLEMGLGGSS